MTRFLPASDGWMDGMDQPGAQHANFLSGASFVIFWQETITPTRKKEKRTFRTRHKAPKRKGNEKQTFFSFPAIRVIFFHSIQSHSRNDFFLPSSLYVLLHTQRNELKPCMLF